MGTRPEIVKLAHITRILGDDGVVVHTGQHYDPGLSDSFFEQLRLPEPEVFLEIGGESRGRQIGLAVTALDESVRGEAAGCRCCPGRHQHRSGGGARCKRSRDPVVHVEAGLRSNDRRMPEEHNRVVTDHLADLLLAPTETSRANLLAEGIPDERIVVTGNTVVEAVGELMPDADERRALAASFGVEPGRFVLSTFHRPENVDDADTLETILVQLAALPYPVLLPLHPSRRCPC